MQHKQPVKKGIIMSSIYRSIIYIIIGKSLILFVKPIYEIHNNQASPLLYIYHYSISLHRYITNAYPSVMHQHT